MRSGYFLGEPFFAAGPAVLTAPFFATTGAELFALEAFLALFFLAAITGFFVAGAATAFFNTDTTFFVTGFFADLAARVGFFAIAVPDAGAVLAASPLMCTDIFGAHAL